MIHFGENLACWAYDGGYSVGGAAGDCVMTFDGSGPHGLQVGVFDGGPVGGGAQDKRGFEAAVVAGQFAEVIVLANHGTDLDAVNGNGFQIAGTFLPRLKRG
jgi:hypothetical protein